AYVPRFQRREATPQPAPPPPAPPEPATAALGAAHDRAMRRRKIIAAVVGVVLVAALPIALRFAPTPPPASGLAGRAEPPEMLAFWRPFLAAGTPLLISFESRMFLFAPSTGLVVRDFQTNEAADVPRSKPLAAFRERMGADQLVETRDYADVGA